MVWPGERRAAMQSEAFEFHRGVAVLVDLESDRSVGGRVRRPVRAYATNSEAVEKSRSQRAVRRKCLSLPSWPAQAIVYDAGFRGRLGTPSRCHSCARLSSDVLEIAE